jgi:hypothetical protein
MNQTHRDSAPFLITMGIWFILAAFLGAQGRLASLPVPLPQLIIAGLTLALILSGALHPGLREWLAHVNLRGFVEFHLTRLVGIVFLVMHARGELTADFAITAGWGDIIAATGAAILAIIAKDPLQHRTALFLWNSFGLFDILLVVVTATRIAFRAPEEIMPLLRFPMSLVPTFIVPIIIASHVLIFWRLKRADAPLRS